MALLKKLKGSTLMETLVATILIMVIFVVASTILNNIFSNSIKGNTINIDAQLNELYYRYINNKLQIPYEEDQKNWHYSVSSFIEKNQRIIEFESFNKVTNQTVNQYYFEAQ